MDILNKSSRNIKFIFKEHPSSYGKRLINEYKEILKYPNAVIIHPKERSNDVLDRVDNVVVDNGTVGIEALLRGKRVISLDRSYYDGQHPNLIKAKYVSTDLLNADTVQYDNSKLIKYLLEGWVASDYIHSSDQSIYDPQPVAKAIVNLIKKGIYLGE